MGENKDGENSAFTNYFNEFSTKTNCIRRIQIFEKICKILQNSTDLKFIDQKAWQSITEFATKNVASVEQFKIVISAFIKANENFPIVKLVPECLILLENLFYISIDNEDLFDSLSSFFFALISNKKAAQDFATDGFDKIFNIAFTLHETTNASRFLHTLVFDKSNGAFFTSLTPRSLQRMVDTIGSGLVKPNNVFLCAEFFVLVIQSASVSNVKLCDILKKEGIVQNIISFIKGLTDSEKESILFRLIESGTPPNTDVIAHLGSPIEPYMSRALIGIAKKYHKQTQKMQQLLPFSKVVESGITSGEVLDVIKTLSENNPALIPQCTCGLLKSLDPKTCDAETYVKAFVLIDKQLLRRQISLSELYRFNFLQKFIVELPHEYIIKLFKISGTFVQLMLDVYSICDNEDIKQRVMSTIFELTSFKEVLPMLTTAMSGFLCVWPSPEVVKRVMKLVDTKQFSDLSEALIIGCTKNVKVADAFVANGGIKWTLDGFFSNAMTEKQLSLLVASLAAQPVYKELDERIAELPNDHPLFSINKDYVEPIVFGTKQMTLLRQIRITSMFHLLPVKEVGDPYNLWMIGKNCLSRLTQEDKNAIVPAVANRYVLPEHVTEIINTTPEIDKCCNPGYDHFPVFQFFPGQSEFVINTEYALCSFWFRFGEYVSYEVCIFKTNLYENVNLQITVRDTTLTAECDGQKMHAEIDAVSWNFVVVRVELGMMSSSIHINTGVDEIVFQLKKKFQFLSKATFGCSKQTVVLLGSSIRFGKQFAHDFSVMEGRGPGSMKPSSYIKEHLIITPLNADSSILPSNCFTVQYFGLSRHMHSAIHQHELINLLSIPEKATSALIAIANIAIITKGTLKYFLERTISALKKFRPKIDNEVLKVQLKILIEQYMFTKKDLFQYIFDDIELWEALPNEVLVEIIIDLFSSRVNLRTYESAELFFAERVMQQPTNQNLIVALLNNHRLIPKTFRYIVALMKCHPGIDSLEWSAISDRPQDVLQLTISEALATIIKPSNVDFIAQILPFDEMKYLMISSHDQMAMNFFHIICSISFLIPNYIQFDQMFLTSVCRLTGYPQAWKDALELALGNLTGSKVIKNISTIPLLLHLTWSSALVIYHSKCYKIESERLTEIEGYMNLSLASCMGIIQRIVDSTLCIPILLFFFPLIMNHMMLFTTDSNDEKDRPPPINSDHLTTTQLSDSTDSLWQGLSIPSSMKFSAPPLPYTPHEFLRSTILSIFRGFGITMQQGEPDCANVIQWMTTSPLFLFMADALFKSSTYFSQLSRAFFIGSPFRYDHKPKEITQQFLHIVMSCMTVPLSPDIPFARLFQFINFLAGLNLLTENCVQIVSDLLLLCSSIVWSFNDNYLMKLSDQLLPVLLQLIAITPEDKQEEMLVHIRANIKIIVSMVTYNKYVAQWLYCFIVIYKIKDEALKWFEGYDDKQMMKNAREDVTKLAPQWEEFKKHFHKIFDEASSNTKMQKNSFVDFGQISRDTIKSVFIANSKHFLIAHMFKAALNHQTPLPQIRRQLRKWDNFRFALMENMRENANENPENNFFSMKCLPFFPPKLFSPIAEDLGIAKFHNKNFIPSSQCFNVFNKVFERFGHPQIINQCVFMRYGDVIPSVFIAYSECFVVILFASIQNNELVLIDDHSEIFDQSLLAGQIGKLWLFDSHFVVEINKSDLLAIHCSTKDSINVWSFSYGNFLLRFANDLTQSITNYVTSIDESVTKTFLFDHLLDQVKTKKDALTRWQNYSISTYQFILILNALSGYSFSDIDMFPSFPPFLDPPESDPGENIPFPSGCEVSMVMSSVSPFKNLPKTEYKSNSLPATVYAIPEIRQDKFESMKLKTSLETENSRIECMQWARTHFVVKPLRATSLASVGSQSNLLSQGLKYRKQPEIPYQLPPLSGRTNMLKSAFVVIDTQNIKLDIIDGITNKVYVCYVDHAFERAYAMSVSSNGLFVVVDFTFGETRAYRIEYEHDLPKDITLLSSYSSPSLPRSTVSGFDWLCATAYSNKVVMWDIVSGLVHRTITMEGDILKASFDTKQSNIWIALHEKAFVYTINGTFLASIDTPPLKWIIADYDIFCETESGDQLVLELDFAKGRILLSSPSENELPHINYISSQNNLRRILSYDAAMKKWDRCYSQSRVEYSHCAICNAPAHGVCRICKKAICEQCTIFDPEGPICKNCSELTGITNDLSK